VCGPAFFLAGRDLCAESKTNIKQTPEFKQAVISCLTKGYATKAIALVIHKTATDDGCYPGESRGKGLNYEKIQAAVASYKRSL